jgi:Cd2+/Zn2+-exporting ATPase
MTTVNYITIPLALRERGDCFNCIARLKDDLYRLKGVKRVEKADDPSQMLVEFDSQVTSLEVIESYVTRQGLKLKTHYGHEHYNIDGIDCPDCALKLEQSLSKIPGITWVSLNYATAKIWFEYEPEVVSREHILATIRTAGYLVSEPEVSSATAAITQSFFVIKGLDCPDCVSKLQKKIAQLEGVHEAQITFTNSSMTVSHEAAKISRAAIIAAVEEAGYSAALAVGESSVKPFSLFSIKNKKVVSTILSGCFILVAWAVHLLRYYIPFPSFPLGTHTLTLTHLFYLCAIFSGGYFVAKSGYHSLRAKTFDMNFLMSVAVVGALGIGEFAEGAMVVFLFSLGNALQSYTMDKARNAIKSLMDLSPKDAHLKRGGRLLTVPVSELAIGDAIIIKPGEKVSVDGTITQGTSPIDESPITGESLPLEKLPGDRVFAGSLNGPGALEVKVEKLAIDSTLSRIIYLVEEAQAQKAPSQNFVDAFSKIYTPLILAGATLVSIIPPLFFSLPFTDWFYRGLMLLVISCPCALVLSTPVSIVSAIACASRKGVLIKGGAYLEEMGSISAIAFDKTGTLTRSHFDVTDVVPIGESAIDEVIKTAASLEMKSEHPLAQAIIQKAHQDSISLREPLDLSTYPGQGLKATLDGQTALIGNLAFFHKQGIATKPYEREIERLENEGKTPILIHHNTTRGIIALADTVRKEAKTCIEELKNQGIKHIILLTGDNERVTAAVAQHLTVDGFQAAMLPEEKVDAVKKLAVRYKKVAMVGDGINDAPALAVSSVGIAMGAAGTDAALESADIALLSDDLLKLPFLVYLSRRTLKTIKINLAFSLIVKAAFITVVFLGLANLWMAVAADMGTSLMVTLYGMRLVATRWNNTTTAITCETDSYNMQPTDSCGCGQNH